MDKTFSRHSLEIEIEKKITRLIHHFIWRIESFSPQINSQYIADRKHISFILHETLYILSILKIFLIFSQKKKIIIIKKNEIKKHIFVMKKLSELTF